MRTFLFISLSLFSAGSFAQTLEPTETEALLKVIVVNEKDKPMQGEKVTFAGQNSKKTYSGITNENGRFEMLVPEGDKYKVGYKTFKEAKDYSVIQVPSEAGMINFDYKLTIETPKVFTLDNVFFDTGKSTLKPESFKELEIGRASCRERV